MHVPAGVVQMPAQEKIYEHTNSHFARRTSGELEALPRGLATSGAVEARNRLGSISGGKILDVATGPGDYIQTLMKALKNYDTFVGIDILKEDLESAKKRFINQPVKLLEMNAESMEFNDDYFDTACMAYSLHHLDQIDKVLTEMLRVLKPGGTILIQEEFRDGKPTDAQKTNILQHAWDAQIDSLLGKTHKMIFTKQEIQGIFDGLQLEEVEMFESTRPIECLFCEDKFKCEDPFWEDRISVSIKEIDDNIKRLVEVADLKTRKKLLEKGEKLKERNMKFGNAPPSMLLIVAKKLGNAPPSMLLIVAKKPSNACARASKRRASHSSECFSYLFLHGEPSHR